MTERIDTARNNLAGCFDQLAARNDTSPKTTFECLKNCGAWFDGTGANLADEVRQILAQRQWTPDDVTKLVLRNRELQAGAVVEMPFGGTHVVTQGDIEAEDRRRIEVATQTLSNAFTLIDLYPEWTGEQRQRGFGKLLEAFERTSLAPVSENLDRILALSHQDRAGYAAILQPPVAVLV